MKGLFIAVLCILLLADLANSQTSLSHSLLNINPFRESCLAPCRLTCSFFSLGCSLPTCQVCIASCENVCDTRDTFSFPDVLGIGGLFPFLSWPGQNGFDSFGLAFTNNGAHSNHRRRGLLDLFFPKAQPATQQAKSGGGGLLNLLIGGQNKYASSRNTPPGPSVFELMESFVKFSGPLLKSMATSLENRTAAFYNALSEFPKNISTELLYNSYVLDITNSTSSNSSEPALD